MIDYAGMVSEAEGERAALAERLSDLQALSEIEEKLLRSLPCLTIRETARLFRVHKLTVWRWVKSGKLKAEWHVSGWRIPRAEIERLSSDWGEAHRRAERAANKLPTPDKLAV